jgi:hypothetical protein
MVTFSLCRDTRTLVLDALVSRIVYWALTMTTTNIYKAPFYKPPVTSTPYPSTLEPGQIVLYKDDNWNSESLTINIYSSPFPSGYPFAFTGTPLQDSATWIAFCLPPGIVCTLFDNTVSPTSNPYNFAGAGVCVDLIGDGTTQTVDLNIYGANDCLSAGIWREVDISEGWFQLFRDSDCSGPFNSIFFDEWPTASFNSLSGWWINNEASSVNYPCLTPSQILLLNANSDGSGQQTSLGASNPFGNISTPATVNLGDSGMNDKVQSFAYTLIQPVKAVIQSVSTSYQVPIPDGQTIEQTVTGANATSTPIVVDCSVGQSQTYSVTNTTTLQYTMSLTVSTTVTVTEGVKDVSSTSGSITTSFTATSSQTTTKSTTLSQEIQLGESITLTIPPETAYYQGTATVSYGTLPPLTVTTSGQFYYKPNLPGSVLDPAGSGLYILSTPVILILSGSVGTQVTITTTTAPPSNT